MGRRNQRKAQRRAEADDALRELAQAIAPELLALIGFKFLGKIRHHENKYVRAVGEVGTGFALLHRATKKGHRA